MDKKIIFKNIQKVLVGIAMVAVLTVSSVNPPRAHAIFGIGDIVLDPTNLVQNTVTAVSSGVSAGGITALVTKNYALDPLAWTIAKVVLNSMVQSTVRWINSGFNGSPAFVTNLQNTLLSTSNSNATAFVSQLASNGSIKSPFQNAVAAAVSSNYGAITNGGFFSSSPYTLNKTTTSDAAFFNGNFIQGGGLKTLASAWSSTQNNPIGATLLAHDALNDSNSTAVTNQNQEIKNGNGFLSYKGNCNSKTTTTASGAKTTSLSNTNNCANASILTPGSVIGNELYKSLGSGVDQLVTANQLGDIVNALIGQLLNQVLGNGGLAGTTRASASNGNVSYIDQISNSNTTATSGGGLTATFTQTLTGQQTQLQSFQTQWQTIDTAALAAQTALQSSTCTNAQNAIATIVQPVLTQATTQISKAQTSLTSIQNILTETSTAGTSSAGLAQASTDYATLESSANLPSLADIQYAQAQSVDSGTASPSTLYTQMKQIAQTPNNCTLLQSQS